MKTAVNIGAREVKMLEVIATTEKGECSFGNFYVESEWEGMTKLKSVKNGSCLVVRIEKISFDEIFKLMQSKTPQVNRMTIISGAPDLLAKFAELEGARQ